MANVNVFVPFVIRFETATTGAGLTNERLFEKARKKAFANDPDDLGGATMCGVTLTTYAAYCKRKGYPSPTVERLKSIRFADWLGVLKTMFWDKWKADSIVNQSIAEMLVDWVWASGAYGVKLPQKVLGVKIDGIVGNATLSAVNSQDPATLFAKLKTERIAYIDRICKSRPANKKYRNGWLNRINALKYREA